MSLQASLWGRVPATLEKLPFRAVTDACAYEVSINITFFRQPKDASSIGVEERVLDVGDVQRSSSIVSSVPLKQDEDLKYLQEGLLKGHAVDNTYEGLHFSWDYFWEETVLSVEGSHFWVNSLTPVLARQPSVRHLNKESFLLPLHTRRL
jgi:hypothetical protein